MRRWLVLAAVAIAIAPVTGAHASAAKPREPLFTCPNPGVCIFQHDDYTGIHHTYVPSQVHGFWSFISGIFPPSGTGVPRSVNNDSGSAAEFFSTDSGFYRCVAPHTREGLDAHDFNYIYITYGVTNCNSIPPWPG